MIKKLRARRYFWFYLRRITSGPTRERLAQAAERDFARGYSAQDLAPRRNEAAKPVRWPACRRRIPLERFVIPDKGSTIPLTPMICPIDLAYSGAVRCSTEDLPCLSTRNSLLLHHRQKSWCGSKRRISLAKSPRLAPVAV